jgi:hypothetical protein
MVPESRQIYAVHLYDDSVLACFEDLEDAQEYEAHQRRCNQHLLGVDLPGDLYIKQYFLYSKGLAINVLRA